ncbi:Zinc finger matrin-type protein 5 U11/U12 small nuclear ribonucleoprotein 20 kDa protein [Collichthys lucidus]|uniref:Zinc finger matrin-type protein 5 n=1 Tax=Collichthys lucidus TaxID=240159 RepID=A0A4V6ARH5_COLLU|nr:Zinc finger matrin-type protein 5 U11/U12 small nuclear ribonucleoprotein 20 kDa protein [Collichthys lucidus]
MGKRYYCDYCDRSFQDNMHNRKKHLNGVQHHRAKKAWFDHFRGIEKLRKTVKTAKQKVTYLHSSSPFLTFHPLLYLLLQEDGKSQ